MIAALAAYKETLALAAESNAGQTAKKMGNASLEGCEPRSSPNPNEKTAEGFAPGADSVDTSASPNVFSAVDSFFNLGNSNRFDDFHKLSPKDQEQFVKMVAEIAKAGCVGYEEYVVNGRVERHDVTTSMADPRLHGARIYNSSYGE